MADGKKHGAFICYYLPLCLTLSQLVFGCLLVLEAEKSLRAGHRARGT